MSTRNRRRFLASLASAGTVGLAGCAGSEIWLSDSSENKEQTTTEAIVRTDESTAVQTTTEGKSVEVPTVVTTEPTPTPTPTPAPTESSSSKLVSCDSRDPVDIQAGELPVQWSKAVPPRWESQRVEDDEYTEYEESNVDPGIHSRTYLEGHLGGDGGIAMNAGTNQGCLWEAPETGHYEVSATYHGWGSYTFGPPETQNHKYTACSETNIAAIRNCETVVSSDTRPHLRVGRAGLATEVAETLLEELASRLVKPFLGLVGSIIADLIISWAIDLRLPTETQGGFPGDILEEYTISTTFSASKGEIYNLQLTTSSGFSAKTDIDWNMFGAIDAHYRLLSMEIKPV
ncbi:hypothetical protein [Haloarcula argentinensis]|uniref:Uncharacterized protein n=1 Tax=Haloarcula argentinensis TaxID=43776 RepID=A0ABU2F720_HALAR|nr:hypothetical protein [Haloarcula argentinensis]MDS0255820.1 hypothetical protein [Haloarcula argentinensis]